MADPSITARVHVSVDLEPRTRPSKERTMMRIAHVVSERSPCLRRQVGCVLTDPDMEQITGGYNGTYKGGPNVCIGDALTSGACGCIHAEVNAGIKAPRGPKLAFITCAPCRTCAQVLVNLGVISVFFDDAGSNASAGLLILSQAGVKYQQLRAY